MVGNGCHIPVNGGYMTDQGGCRSRGGTRDAYASKKTCIFFSIFR